MMEIAITFITILAINVVVVPMAMCIALWMRCTGYDDVEETLDELGKEFRIKERPASKDLEQVCDIIGWAMENRCDRMTLDKPSEGGQGTIIGTADNRGTNPATRSHPGR